MPALDRKAGASASPLAVVAVAGVVATLATAVLHLVPLMGVEDRPLALSAGLRPESRQATVQGGDEGLS